MDIMRVFFFAVFVFQCVKGDNECPDCSCCRENQKCTNNPPYGKGCFYGCIDGYYGQQCAHACMSKCITCSNSDICHTCEDGYYNGWSPSYNGYRYDCQNQCRDECLSCTSYNDCTACRDGKYGSYCQIQCPDECLSCTSYNYCTACKIGKYGRYCQNICSEGCRNGVCEKDDGRCQCKSSYFAGYNCNTCASWWSGQNCQTPCPVDCYEQCTRDGVCYGCKTGKYGSKCKIFCGVNCKNHICDQYGGKCSSGCNIGFTGEMCDQCIDGKYGSMCTQDCMSNCKSCYDASSCATCVNGYYMYGPACKKCPFNCEQCNSETDCTVCDHGFFGKTCEKKCPNICSACDPSNGDCLSCIQGYYGRNCSFRCYDNCEDCEFDNGACTMCRDGYYGVQCNNKCSDNCKRCEKVDGSCSLCNDGYYKNSQACGPCHVNCKTCTWYQECTSCINGMYGGSYCSYSCPTKCSNSTCDKVTGICAFGCVSEYWGDKCQNQCPQTCKDKTCFSKNGTCIHGCEPGFTGTKCNCPENCECDYAGNCLSCKGNYENIHSNCACSKDVCSDTVCSSCSEPTSYAQDGTCCLCDKRCKDGMCDSKHKCTKGCIDNFFGDDCSGRCNNHVLYCNRCTTQNSMFKCLQCHTGYYPSNVTNSCMHCSYHCVNETCNSSNGICSNGCKPGRWGDRCENMCSINCEQCYQESGDCEVCASGKYFKDCSKSCSVNCNSTGNVGICGIDDGQCLNGCATFTRYGSHCENQCSSNCKTGKCELTTGNCLEGCVYNTLYGSFCNNSCSHNCIRNAKNVRTCDESNGYCIDGCVDNFYGDTCEKECSPNCANRTCDRSSGNCVSGCSNGYTGLQCSAMKLKDEADTATATVGGAVGTSVLLLIIGAVIAVVVIVKRRRRQNKDDRIDTTDRVSDAIAYSNMSTTPAEHVNIGTVNLTRFSKAQDAIYAKPNKTKKPDADNRKERESPKVNVGKEFAANTGIYENTVIRRTLPSNDEGDQVKNAHKLRVIATESTLEEEDLDAVISSNECEKNESKIAGIPVVSDTYYNAEAFKRRRINVHELDKHVLKKNQDDFNEEFQQLPVGLIKPYTVSQRPANTSKNRYKGIYPYDETRVVLTDVDSDYINANYINGYNNSRGYIASIGPTIKYMGDMSVFWIMIWQEKVGKVVILTRLTEAGTQKFDQYWPDEGADLMFSDIIVTCKSEEHYAEYTVRTFVAERASEKRNIVQVHFTSWPDKGIPDDVVSLIECRDKVTSINTELDGPILVHCSAGIGRTGTYIALDSLIFEGEAEGEVDIYACVRNLREQRLNMVQTAEQYGFLYHVLAHRFALDSKPVDASGFSENFESHAVERLGERFKKLQACIDQRLDGEIEAVNKNKKFKQRNREGGDIPGNLNRPRLYLGIETGGSDYINAVYVNSFRSANRYIIAQTPLPETVEDFLTLIYQENVSCVIDMEPPTPKEKSVGVYYLADNQTLNKGKITVTSDPGVTTDQYIYRKLHIQYKGKETHEDRVVGDIQYTQWNEGNVVPDDPAKFVQFIKDVETNYCNGERSGPVLIHCLSGAKRSGLFCVVSTLIEKLQSDQQIRVINTVRHIKNRRYMAIQNIDQFKFCHQCVHEYLESFDTYANIDIQR